MEYRNNSTHYCSRCKAATPIGEWVYMEALHAWRHTRMFDATSGQGTVRIPCGWIDRIPARV